MISFAFMVVVCAALFLILGTIVVGLIGLVMWALTELIAFVVNLFFG